MIAAELRAHSRAFLNPSDACVQVRHTQQNVIEGIPRLAQRDIQRIEQATQ
jgi:hypothetical protein